MQTTDDLAQQLAEKARQDALSAGMDPEGEYPYMIGRLSYQLAVALEKLAEDDRAMPIFLRRQAG